MSVGGCHCLPLSHCLSDLPRVETSLSDHARRLGELSNFNVKSCNSGKSKYNGVYKEIAETTF